MERTRCVSQLGKPVWAGADNRIDHERAVGQVWGGQGYRRELLCSLCAGIVSSQRPQTPITEAGFAGMAVGAALSGLRPVCEFSES